MKRGGPEHPKVRRLARALNIPEYAAVGLLECLFHWTARYAPAGDIGRWGTEDVARGIGWDGDPDTLFESLEKSGWLEKHTECVFCVHDWADHADDTVHLAMARAKRWFVCGATPRMTRLSKDERKPLEDWYARNAHGMHTPCTPLPLPSQALPSPPHPRHQDSEPTGGGDDGVVSLSVEEVGRYRLILARPTWLPQESPWIDAVKARDLARLPTSTTPHIEYWKREAYHQRKGLKNPAGYLITKLSKPDPGVLASLSGATA